MRIFLEQELHFLAKGATEHVPLPEREAGFYSQYFIVTKKGRVLRPILDLKGLNHILWTYTFKIQDWFVTKDLKDTYFHIEKFLMFAFRGEVYQYGMLPFGLALSPTHIHQVHGYCSSSSVTPGHLCTELHRRLPQSGSVGRVNLFNHDAGT